MIWPLARRVENCKILSAQPKYKYTYILC